MEDSGGENTIQCLLEQFLGITYLKRHFQQLCEGCEMVSHASSVKHKGWEYLAVYFLLLLVVPLHQVGDLDWNNIQHNFFTFAVKLLSIIYNEKLLYNQMTIMPP